MPLITSGNDEAINLAEQAMAAADAAQADVDALELSKADVGHTHGGPVFADLPTPIYVAHRGGANVFPDQALESYQAAAALGGVVLEADIYKLRDGGAVCMHDSTVDRTTSWSGSTANLGTPAVSRLRIDAGQWFLAGYPDDLRVPTMDEFLLTCKGRVAVCPEAKGGGSGQVIADRLVALGMTDSALVQSFSTSELAPSIAAGISTGYLHSTGSGVDWAAVKALGVDWALLGSGSAQASFDAAAAAGLRLGVWTVNRHVDRDKFLSWGCELIFSDDPWYLKETHRTTTDPFDSGTYYHGHLGSAASAGSISAQRGFYQTGGWWGLDVNTQTGYFATVLQGWACPIDGDPNADAFQIDFNAVIDSVEASSNWGSVFIGRADDTHYDDTIPSTDRISGWHLLFRQNGALDIYKVTNGVGAPQVATVTCSSAPALGASRAYRVVVTPTTITWSAPGIGAPNSVSYSDSAYRGGYFFLGASNAQVRYQNVTIT